MVYNTQVDPLGFHGSCSCFVLKAARQKHPLYDSTPPARIFLPYRPPVLSLHKDFCVVQIMSLCVGVAQKSRIITVRALTGEAHQPCAYCNLLGTERTLWVCRLVSVFLRSLRLTRLLDFICASLSHY